MQNPDIQSMLDRFRRGEIDRRSFITRAVASGLTFGAAGMLAGSVAAQDATPGASAESSGEVIKSITREEYFAQLRQTFPLEAPETPGGELIVTYSKDVMTLNPILRTDVYSGYITQLLFEGLVGTSPIDGSVVPSGVADRWEIGADGVTYTFFLNPNATWEDGTPITADDVIFTFDSVLADDSPSVRKSTVEGYLASYSKIDDHTLELVSFTPSAVFLNKTALLFEILPKHIWGDIAASEFPTDAGSTGQDPTRVVASGPFRFVEWQMGDHLTLERNPNYWDQENAATLDRYIFDVKKEDTTVISALKTGESDVCQVPATFARELEASNPELQIAQVDTASFTFYVLNQNPDRSPLFTDVRVRQAMYYAIDRDVYANTILDGFATRADGPQAVLSPAYAPDRMNTIYEVDPEKAKSLLEEAGWVDSDGDGIREKDGVKFSFDMLYDEGEVSYTQGIPYIQQCWREIGIELIAAATPFTVILDRINTSDLDAVLIGFSWGFDGIQGDMFRCNATSPNGFNIASFCSPEYDQLDAEASAELDPEKRREIMIEAANIVNDEQAVGVIAYPKNIYGGSPRLRNFLPQGYLPYWWVRYAWFSAE
ncbi:MAG TPA: ABC transporter substrate-binding protein [Thermomicrobiales bacterium]|nr:ABC transporter substrate-binding protein [Thermomicrobiales bacterium]